MQVVPPKGAEHHPTHFTYERDGQYAVGSDRESLINNLQAYRVANNLDIGDPEADVDVELGMRSSAYHPPLSAGALETRPKVQRTFLDRVRDWLAGLYAMKAQARTAVGTGLSYVTRAEAERRALICSKCPKNIEWRNNCSPCVQDAEGKVINLSRGLTTRYSDLLFACQVTAHENRVSIWLEKKFLPKSRLPEYRKELPSFCWLLKK